MSLRISRIKLADFRSHDSFNLDGIGDLTVFIGPNGVGKTNILEGIQLLVSATTFRYSTISQLIYEGKDNGILECMLVDGKRQLDVSLTLSESKRRYAVNGKARSTADMKGLIPTISFVPDDMQLVKGSSSRRREALDLIGGQLSKNYYMIRQDYEKLIKQKNKLLKEEASTVLLESIDDTLVSCGARLFSYRLALFNRLVPFISKNYEDISGAKESFSARYIPSWDYLEQKEDEKSVSRLADMDKEGVESLFSAKIKTYRQEELARRRALVGPHNDKIILYLDGRDASDYASQGQQRSVVLAWKMAEADLIIDMKDTRPVLLLDDVLSELDTSRREKLVAFVSRSSQAFITATDLSFFPAQLATKALIVELGKGRETAG